MKIKLKDHESLGYGIWNNIHILYMITKNKFYQIRFF